MTELQPLQRLPLLLLGMLALVAGTGAGLLRLGLAAPLSGEVAAGHGALMIAAFFGTVIALERAVALARLWPYLAPLAAGLGGLGLVLGAPAVLAAALGGLGAAVLCLASLVVLRRQPALFTATLAAGALAWLAGNLAWLGGAGILAATPLWIAFLVLTIAGERLELTRFLPPRPLADRVFVMVVAMVAGGALASPFHPEAGLALFAAGLLGLALWLLRHDIARRTVRQSGLTRFVAVCLLSGYGWLALGGGLGLAGALAPGHPWRDAALHAVLLGFVFSMVIGHAPIIFPAVMRVKIPWHPVFYLPLAALHLSLLARVAGGLLGDAALRQAGGAANALALLLFVATLLGRVVAGRRRQT